MAKVFDQLGEALLIPTRVALRTEKHGALVVVDAVDFPSKFGKVETNFRADEARGSGDEQFFHKRAELAVFSVQFSAASKTIIPRQPA
jgi:hypothetical protein